jgi:hypothetical protein
MYCLIIGGSTLEEVLLVLLSHLYLEFPLCFWPTGLFYLPLKAQRDAGPKHEGDGKVCRPRRMIGKIRHQHRSGRSIYKDDRIFRHPHASRLFFLTVIFT